MPAVQERRAEDQREEGIKVAQTTKYEEGRRRRRRIVTKRSSALKEVVDAGNQAVVGHVKTLVTFE